VSWLRKVAGAVASGVGVITGAVASGQLNLPDPAMPLIAMVGMIAAWLTRSPLPQKRVNPPNGTHDTKKS